MLLFFTKCARFAYFYTENVQKPLKIIRFLRKSGRKFCIVLVLVRRIKEKKTVPSASFLSSCFKAFLNPFTGSFTVSLQCLYSLLTVLYCLPNFRFVTSLQPSMGTMSSQAQALHIGMLHLMCSVRLFDLNG